MKPIVEIALLTNKHGSTFGECKGCKICDRIQELRSVLEMPPEEKYKNILDKGKDMTQKEKTFLKNKGVPVHMIISYAKQKPKGVDEMAALTKKELIEYTNAGMSTEEIAKQAGVKPQTVYTYRKKYGLSSKKDKANPKSEYKQAMNEVAAAMVANPDITDKLKARISELEEQMMEHYRKRVEAEEKVQNLEAAAEDLEKENEENAQKARQMEEEMNNFAAEVDEWRERARSYAEENERLNDANKDLRMMLQQSQRKEKLYAAALKEAL